MPHRDLKWSSLLPKLYKGLGNLPFGKAKMCLSQRVVYRMNVQVICSSGEATSITQNKSVNCEYVKMFFEIFQGS